MGETRLLPLRPPPAPPKEASESCFCLVGRWCSCTDRNRMQRSVFLTVTMGKGSQRSCKLISTWDPQSFGLQGERAESHPSCSVPARVSLGAGLCTSNSRLLTGQIPSSQRAARCSQPEGRKAQPRGRTHPRKLHQQFTTPLYPSGSRDTRSRSCGETAKVL